MTPIVRNLRFEIDQTVPKYWHGGRRSVTIFLDNLSVFFPAWERFFVKAVRAHQSFVKDEELMKDVRAFCGQEGVHGREHERMNEVVKSQGYPIEDMEKRVQAILDRVSANSPEIMQLGVTCALEHFTALMGEMLLGSRGLLEGAHPAMVALWNWHAAEENEHKNVAFDVYRAAGGDYTTRVLSMIGATFIFWTKVIEQQARMMKSDGILLSGSEWYGLFKFLFINPGGMAPLFRLYFEYFRPSFHPSDIDCTPLLEQWRREFAEQPVYARSAAAARPVPRDLAVAS
jgi:predicted metal-dependent hydrolase